MKKLETVGKDKLRYELNLKALQQDCESLEKTIQEEKYRIEIAQARNKKEMEEKFQRRKKLFMAEAKETAEIEVQKLERDIHAVN